MDNVNATILDEINKLRAENELLLERLRELNKLPNVTIRPSAIRMDEPAPVVEGLSYGSGVAKKRFRDTVRMCPAPSQGNACQDCRACWNNTGDVYYHAH